MPEPHAPISDGWKLVAEDDNHKLTVSHNGSRWQVNLDADGQGPMESHCWL